MHFFSERENFYDLDIRRILIPLTDDRKVAGFRAYLCIRPSELIISSAFLSSPFSK